MRFQSALTSPISRRILSATVRGVAAAATLGAAIVVGGCSSAEVHSYESTTMAPQTITLLNTATGEKIWTCEVPIGKRLDIRFVKTPRAAEEAGFDEMSWQISGMTDKPEGRRSTLKVPPPSHRRLDMTLRPYPELGK